MSQTRLDHSQLPIRNSDNWLIFIGVFSPKRLLTFEGVAPTHILQRVCCLSWDEMAIGKPQKRLDISTWGAKVGHAHLGLKGILMNPHMGEVKEKTPVTSVGWLKQRPRKTGCRWVTCVGHSSIRLPTPQNEDPDQNSWRHSSQCFAGCSKITGAGLRDIPFGRVQAWPTSRGYKKANQCLRMAR